MRPEAEKLYKSIQGALAKKNPYLYARASCYHSAHGKRMREGKYWEREQSKCHYEKAVALWDLALKNGAVTC